MSSFISSLNSFNSGDPLQRDAMETFLSVLKTNFGLPMLSGEVSNAIHTPEKRLSGYKLNISRLPFEHDARSLIDYLHRLEKEKKIKLVTNFVISKSGQRRDDYCIVEIERDFFVGEKFKAHIRDYLSPKGTLERMDEDIMNIARINKGLEPLSPSFFAQLRAEQKSAPRSDSPAETTPKP